MILFCLMTNEEPSTIGELPDTIFGASSGLDKDYRNAWYYLPFVLINLKEGGDERRRYLESLARPIPTYEEYHRAQNAHRYEQTMARANPEAMAALDAVVEEYNELCLLRKRHEATIQSYFARVEAILRS